MIEVQTTSTEKGCSKVSFESGGGNITEVNLKTKRIEKNITQWNNKTREINITTTEKITTSTTTTTTTTTTRTTATTTSTTTKPVTELLNPEPLTHISKIVKENPDDIKTIDDVINLNDIQDRDEIRNCIEYLKYTEGKQKHKTHKDSPNLLDIPDIDKINTIKDKGDIKDIIERLISQGGTGEGDNSVPVCTPSTSGFIGGND